MRGYEIINCVDLECTCYGSSGFPQGETQEIIEVGITQIDLTNCKILTTESILVHPTVSNISEYCTKLTSITPEMVKYSCTFPEVCQTLKNGWSSSELPWISYGQFDRNMFSKQCALMGLKNPMSNNHLNVAAMFCYLTGRKKRVGMKRMMNALELSFEGRQHRGDVDSRNLARAFVKILDLAKIKA